jgi:uncharacterized repeat protein (TIGR03803 family)
VGKWSIGASRLVVYFFRINGRIASQVLQYDQAREIDETQRWKTARNSVMSKINGWYVAWTACGVAIATFGAIAAADAASNAKVLYSFCSQSGCTDGAVPSGGLISDEAGNFYGTTYFGGQEGPNCANFGYPCGTVFKLAPDGTETVLHTFTGDDGGNPRAGLIADKVGNLYGTTIAGGSGGGGTVFKVTPDGTETVLHSFQGGSDGYEPTAAVIIDKRGNLFGTTVLGGSSAECNGSNDGCGTVFEVKSDGEEKVLYAFQGGTDGGLPYSGLIADKAGNLYGTAAEGGVVCEGFTQGCGTIYRLAPDGTETVLYAFAGGSDGMYPDGTLIGDKAGNFYGTTNLGGAGVGCGSGCGTVFKLSPDGSETVLYAFQGGNDGASPYAGLITDKAGNFYGTTDLGGEHSSCKKGSCGGTVFKLTPDGGETVLYAFGKKTGANPIAPLFMDRRGTLFGTAQLGAAHSEGAVFRVNP